MAIRAVKDLSRGHSSTGKISPFASVCRRMREEHGVYMADQAKAFNCSVSFVSAVETGQKNITVEYIKKFVVWLKLNGNEISELEHVACISSRSIKLTPTTYEQLQLSKRIAELLPTLGPREIVKLDEILEKLKCKKVADSQSPALAKRSTI